MARLAAWKRPASWRNRWLVSGACRAADGATKARMEERWGLVAGFSQNEKAGLRRLASRLAEITDRRRTRLDSEIRAIAGLPASERPARWRALPFVRSLTGQELQGGERLLLSF
jgi:hypothetical protein